MRQPTIKIRGPHAGEAERELQELLEAEFGERARRVDPGAPRPGDVRKDVDPGAVVDIVLTISEALLLVLDLSQRLKLKPKLDRLLAWARRKRTEDPTIEVTLTTRDGRTLHLDAATTAELLDALADASAKSSESASGSAGQAE